MAKHVRFGCKCYKLCEIHFSYFNIYMKIFSKRLFYGHISAWTAYSKPRLEINFDSMNVSIKKKLQFNRDN